MYDEVYVLQLEYKRYIASKTNKKPITRDGYEIIVSANVGSSDDIALVKKHGGQSVGLFRTEFLFMKHQNLPSEEVQFQEYKSVAESFNPGMVIIRTLDIGGDKVVSSFELPQEDNPFLGFRGIRIGLEYRDMLQDQLRAIIRASAFGNIKILIPMISSMGEVNILRSMIVDIKNTLRLDCISFDEDIEWGIMVEVPSVLFLIEEIAQEVDFVSIGTNDLTQYLLATDRLNEKVSAYYKPFHPGVFRAIKTVVDAMHKENKWVGVCGELAGMKLALPALIGLGVDELSMAPNLMQEIMFIMNIIDRVKAQTIADRVIGSASTSHIKRLLIEEQKKIISNVKNIKE